MTDDVVMPGLIRHLDDAVMPDLIRHPGFVHGA